ncbi:hypothetical protein RHSIM_Rhsim04G0237600 [Rhododendron simsii]|uniref:Jacalin-type lectin domain-containing protein n=1 Tax=Rhododendron simsii TaxID=118357 RepID=A0A834LQ84_RHOSS|nr:hypothetical protein RHSIM_Rhsim04G0237600 [Rhododendron simsii]
MVAAVALMRPSSLRLNYPSEFLTGINGYHSSRQIVSLTFIINKGIYGQSGRLAGRLNHYDSSFEYNLGADNTFGGFHGTADIYLNSIGVYMKPMTTLSNVMNLADLMAFQLLIMIKIGPPHFTTDGKAWDDGGRDKIVQIFIEHDQHSVISLQFLYAENGNLVSSDKHGGDSISAPKFDVVKLNYPSEYLTGISGSYYCSNACSQWLIFTVAFSTNNRTYEPFGVPHKQGYAFEYQLGEDHPFGGFHGRAGEYLNAIGVYVKPITILDSLFHVMMCRGPKPHFVTYSVLLDGFFKNQEIVMAVEVFRSMEDHGITLDVVVYGILINGMCKAREIEDARKVFRSIPAKGLKRNVKIYNAMISRLCKEALLDEARELLLQIGGDGCSPDDLTYNVVVRTFLKMGDKPKVRILLQEMINMNFSSDASNMAMLIADSDYLKMIKNLESRDRKTNGSAIAGNVDAVSGAVLHLLLEYRRLLVLHID